MLPILFLFISVTGSPVIPRIVNSTNADPNEFPQIVSLRVNDQHLCGATILTEKFLLTAGHCVQFKVDLYSVQYGLTNITQESDAPNVIKVSRLIPHENYLPRLLNFEPRHDLAVVELAEPLEFAPNVQPVKLPKAFNATPEYSIAVVAGWGYPVIRGFTMEDLQKVNLHVYSDAQCENAMYSLNRKYHICAGIPQYDQGGCFRDSGGPLMLNDTQIGIVSFGKECEKYPGVFTKISSYVKWIETKITSEPPKSPGIISSIFDYVKNLFF